MTRHLSPPIPIRGHIHWLISLSGVFWVYGIGPGAIAQAQDNLPANTGEQAVEQRRLRRLKQVPSLYDELRLDCDNRRRDNGELDYCEDRDPNHEIVDQDDTSPLRPTLPSLWWNRDQLPHRWWSNEDPNKPRQWEGYRLVTGWTAFHSMSSGTDIIDIQLDPRYWSSLDGVQQYGILNQLGVTGMSYGYQVRLYSSTELVGVHACDFTSHPELPASSELEIPIPQLSDIPCAVEVGPFFEFFTEDDLNDLFAPP